MKKNMKVKKVKQTSQVQAGQGNSKSAKRRRRIREESAALRSFFEWSGGSIPTPIGPLTPGDIKIGRGRRSVRSRPSQRGPFAERTGMVGLAEHADDDIQVVMPRIRTEDGGPHGTMDVMSGTEFLMSISTSESGNVSGDILATLLINPALFSRTRLKQFADLYQRYRFREFTLFYKPSANATQSGQLIGYGDYDPDRIVTLDNPGNVSVAAAHLGQRVCQIWESKGFPFGIVDDYTSLFVDATAQNDLRLSVQGVFYLLAATALAGESIGDLGNLYCRYTVEFYIPALLENISAETPPLLAIEATTSLTLAKPLGVSPLVDVSLGYPSNLSFSGTGEALNDVYYTSSNGDLIINSVAPGDVWEVIEVIQATCTGGGSPDTILAVSSSLTAANGNLTRNQISSGQDTILNATTALPNSDVLTMNCSVSFLLKVDQGPLAPVILTPTVTTTFGGGPDTGAIVGYKIVLKRLVEGAISSLRSGKATANPVLKKLSLESQRLKPIYRHKAKSYEAFCVKRAKEKEIRSRSPQVRKMTRTVSFNGKDHPHHQRHHHHESSDDDELVKDFSALSTSSESIAHSLGGRRFARSSHD